jgi:pantoate--beta-alanine ligase
VRIAETIAQVREILLPERRAGRRIGLVPTMGALHEGHYSLIKKCRTECPVVAVSIFVNPLQFGPNEDLDAYPRPIEEDLAGCEEQGVDLVFRPQVAAVYGDSILTTVQVRELSEPLCGEHRPGHFDAVATIVAKLFNIVQPDAAYFGEKDYQQLVVVRRMVADLSLPVQIVPCPIVRELDGLAMSSRNRYLSDEERQQAPAIFAALRAGAEVIARGERDARAVIVRMAERIRAGGATRIEYVSIVDPRTLADVAEIAGPVRLCVAAYFGSTRLIDNLGVDAGGSEH